MVRGLDVNGTSVGTALRGLGCPILNMKTIANNFKDMILWGVDEVNIA